MKDYICCPNCGGTEFEGFDTEISLDSKKIRQYFLCGGCASQFMAEYTLTDVVALKEPEEYKNIRKYIKNN